LIVIGATNFPEVLDKALTRPGRFDRHIEVPNPDVKGRTDILTLHSRNVTMSDKVDLLTIARGTPGFSGAELASLINKAACKASKDGKVHVSMVDLEFAKDLILMGAPCLVGGTRKAVTTDLYELTAYHEGGHALVATLTDGALPVHKATIMPRGQSLGMVMQLPDQDMTSWSYRQMIAEMDVCMGGRAAEELIFGVGNITSGASSDLERATGIATSMVEKYGMSSKVHAPPPLSLSLSLSLSL
ncbi:peptidase family M41-domain-containing protein, partial [Baffinella frigidus]